MNADGAGPRTDDPAGPRTDDPAGPTTVASSLLLEGVRLTGTELWNDSCGVDDLRFRNPGAIDPANDYARTLDRRERSAAWQAYSDITVLVMAACWPQGFSSAPSGCSSPG